MDGVPTGMMGVDNSLPRYAGGGQGWGRRSALRKNLWKAGSILATFILTLVIANFFAPADKRFDTHMYGHDFLPFYTAGQFVRSGQIAQLYNPDATKVAEHKTAAAAGLVIRNEYGAFLNPPFAALPAAPLAAWPYRPALFIWTIFLLVCLSASIFLLIQLLPRATPWQTWALIPLLLFAALPAWQAMVHAQNTFVSLAILSAAVFAARSQKPFIAGLIAGLLFYKPQLAAILAAVLVVIHGRRALAGLSLTSALLLLITVFTLHGALTDYLQRMPANLRAIQILPTYTWQRHITFLAWWRLLLQGRAGALPNLPARILAALCMSAVAGALAIAVWRGRRDPPRADRILAAAIAAMPLTMPYFMDYDLTLLSVAAVLCAADAIRHGGDRAILFAWIGLYIAMELNPTITSLTPIIPAVPALTVLSILLIRKAMQPITSQQSLPIESTIFLLAA
jgi:hypothetical protein